MLKDESSGVRAAAVGARARAGGSAAAEGTRTHPAYAPLIAAPSERPAPNAVLPPELRQRVSGDVASFLVALDHMVLEGSLESVAGLQEATDQLMRSVARTRLELERLLGRHEMPRSRTKAGVAQRIT